MLSKRLIGFVTVKDGWAVQSFGYARYLPLGKPEVVIENLDRWGADEIVLQCIDRTPLGKGPDLKLVERVSRLGLSTPLIYGGGIRNSADGVSVIAAGADRICLDALLQDNPEGAAEIAVPLGAQAVIAVLTLSIGAEGNISWHDYRTRRERPLDSRVVDLLRSGALSEGLVVDWRNDGGRGSFDLRLLDHPDLEGVVKIAFGGASEPPLIEAALDRPSVVAVGVGNSLSYREHAVQKLKNNLAGSLIRPATYARAFD